MAAITPFGNLPCDQRKDGFRVNISCFQGTLVGMRVRSVKFSIAASFRRIS